MKHRDEIIRLHNEGKTRPEICNILDCDKSLVCYHLTKGQKEKHYNRTKKRRREKHPIIRKVEHFKEAKYIPKSIKTPRITKAVYSKIREFSKDRKTHTMINQPTYTFEDVMNKIGPNPVCYLTGQPIDLTKPSTYQLDHILPVSRGGDNSLDNMGLCTKEANIAKSNLTVDEFKLLCQQVINNLK